MSGAFNYESVVVAFVGDGTRRALWPLRQDLIKFAEEFRSKAKKTENPWDDFPADIICWLLGIS